MSSPPSSSSVPSAPLPAPSIPVTRHLPSSPVPAYDPVSLTSSPSPIKLPAALLSTLADSPRRLVSRTTVPIRSGHAFRVAAGQVFRLVAAEGAQVGDLNVWSARDPRERFWAARTRQLHAAHLSVGDRLWSCLPFLRPLATITADSLGGGPWETTTSSATDAPGGGGEGRTGPGGIAGCHDLLGTRCDPYVNALLNGGASFDFQCHSNLVRAVLPWGLGERDVHDVLNVFQVTGLDEEGRYWMGTSPARKGDYLEFFAEVDLLCALSTCPGGDLSRFGWNAAAAGGSGRGGGGEAEGGEEGGSGDPMLETCKPLVVEIYEFEDRDKVLRDWTPPERAPYTGYHGIRMPAWMD